MGPVVHVGVGAEETSLYLKKSATIGPLRIKVSKSGLGVSVGVPGLRVGRNAQGKLYIHAGLGGLYWRKQWGKKRQTEEEK